MEDVRARIDQMQRAKVIGIVEAEIPARFGLVARLVCWFNNVFRTHRMPQTPDPRSDLEAAAREALGNVSPQLAWLQIRTMFQHEMEEYRGAAESLAKYENLPESLESLAASMEGFLPIPAINYLAESNPDLDLTDIPHLQPLTILKAVLHTQMTNDRLLS